MSRIRYLDIDELNERLEELEALESAIESAQSDLDDLDADATDEEREEAEDALKHAKLQLTDDDRNELAALRDLKDQIGERHGKINDDGGPFIHEADFEDYAREFAEDIGALDRNARWPMDCIDWAHAARELQMDYTTVEWEGVTYYYRQ